MFTKGETMGPTLMEGVLPYPMVALRMLSNQL